MSLDALDAALAGGGGKSAFNKETPLGTSVSGIITDVSVQQITDFVTGKLKFWDGERPQMQIVIVIQTDLREDSEDDGKRAIYIKTWGVWKENLMTAVRAAGGQKAGDVLKPGNRFTDTYSGTKPSTQGSDTKVHTYKIETNQPALDDALGGSVDTGTGEITPAPQQAVPAPVAAAPVAAPAPAPAAAPAGAPDPVATAKQLIALNIPDNVIAAQTGLADVVIAALKNQPNQAA